MTERAAMTGVDSSGYLRWFWALFSRGATTNTPPPVVHRCTCYVVYHDKGRPVVQNVGCPAHDTQRRSF